jgi:hypothetical protein
MLEVKMTLFGSEPKPKDTVFKLNDPSWRPYSPSVLNKYGITPNKLYYKESIAVGVLAARQSSTYAECAVSKGGIDYLHAAVVEGRISAGYLVLYNNFVVLVEMPIAEVVKMLEGTPPRTDGQWGPYYWFNFDGTPNVRQISGGGRPYMDDDVPF